MNDSPEEVRRSLLTASEMLLSGEAVGPLTGIRLVELAGTKRHRLTHDNPDIAANFKERASQINRTKPEVDSLRAKLLSEQQRNSKLVDEASELRSRLELYASRIDELTTQRDSLLASIETGANVRSIRRGAGPRT